MKIPNTYRVVGDVAYIKTIKKGIEYEIIINETDLEKVKKYRWTLNHDGYPNNQSNRTQTFLHHYIIGRVKGLETDHINQNKLDNRKSNLRNITRAKNLLNLPQRKDSTHGTGISKFGHKYGVSIQYNKKRIFLGLYKTIEEAKKVYKDVKNKLHKI